MPGPSILSLQNQGKGCRKDCSAYEAVPWASEDLSTEDWLLAGFSGFHEKYLAWLLLTADIVTVKKAEVLSNIMVTKPVCRRCEISVCPQFYQKPINVADARSVAPGLSQRNI